MKYTLMRCHGVRANEGTGCYKMDGRFRHNHVLHACDCVVKTYMFCSLSRVLSLLWSGGKLNYVRHSEVEVLVRRHDTHTHMSRLSMQSLKCYEHILLMKESLIFSTPCCVHL